MKRIKNRIKFLITLNNIFTNISKSKELSKEERSLLSDLWVYKSCPTIKDFKDKGVNMIVIGDPNWRSVKEYQYIQIATQIMKDTLNLKVISEVPVEGTENRTEYICHNLPHADI